MPGAPFRLLGNVHRLDQNPEEPKSSGTAGTSFAHPASAGLVSSLRKDNGRISWKQSNQGAAENVWYVKTAKKPHYPQRGLQPPSSCNTPNRRKICTCNTPIHPKIPTVLVNRGNEINTSTPGMVQGPHASQLLSGFEYHYFCTTGICAHPVSSRMSQSW